MQRLMSCRIALIWMGRRRWSVLLLGGFILGLLFHRLLLERAARAFIAEGASTGAARLVILGGAGRFRYAAQEFKHGRTGEILLLEKPPSRLVRLGIVPSPAAVGHRELQRLGVDPSAISTLAYSSRDEWAWGRRLGEWLTKHDTVTAALVCDRFDSAYCRYVLDHTLPEDARARVALRPLRDRRYDEADWWKSFVGIESFLASTLDHGYARLVGESRPVQPEWYPDDYQAALAPCRSP